MSKNDNQKKRINNLFKKVAIMATSDALQFLKNSDEDQIIIDRVVDLITDSKTQSHFLDDKPNIEELFDNLNTKHDLIGQTIGDIDFIKLLGKGGMGEVYLGLDKKLNRKVAIKTIRGNHRFNSNIKERFRREALILSKLDHPNICRIYNIIETQEADFLILEYVKGQTLKTTDTEKLSKKEKINIADSLIKALVVAHDKSIVHRDIKPDNIIVSKSGTTKILDFGISRSLNVTQRTKPSGEIDNNTPEALLSFSNTSTGSLLGTLGYMCPEQANGNEVTPASDIYSLGIVLQELFTDKSAHPAKPNHEMLLQRAKFGITEEINNVPRDIKYLIERMKSFSVEARPKAIDALKILERIKQKPKRRIRLLLLFILTSMAFMAFLKYTYDLKEQTEQAELARDESEQVTKFLASLFDQSNPYKTNGETITARQMLNDGAIRIDNELSQQPHTLTRLKLIIGDTYRRLGNYEPARIQLQKALDVFESNKLKDPKLYIQLLQSMAILEFDLSKLDKAEQILQKAVNFSIENQLEGYPVSLETRYDLAVITSHRGKYSSAELQLKQLLNFYNTNNIINNDQISQINNSLGLLYWKQSNLGQALKYMQIALQLVELVEDSNELKTTIKSNISLVLGDLGRHEEAIKIALEITTYREKALDNNHPDLALAYDNLSYAFFNADLFEESLVWNEKALKIYESALGRKNSDFAQTLANHAVLLRKNEKYKKAELALLEVVNTFTQELGETHQKVADYIIDLGKIYQFQNRKNEAIEQYHKAIKINNNLDRKMTGSNRFFKAWREMASLQDSLGEIENAKKSYTSLLIKLKSQVNPNKESIDLINKELKALK